MRVSANLYIMLKAMFGKGVTQWTTIGLVPHEGVLFHSLHFIQLLHISL